MRIKTVSRSPRCETRETRGGAYVVRRNLEGAQHPFASAREYQRAVVAAKLERMHAKPFVCAIEAHTDGVTCVAAAPMVRVASGSADGEVKVWDVAARRCVATNAAGVAVTGIAFVDGKHVASCGGRSLRVWGAGSWTSDGTLNDVDASGSMLCTASAAGVVQLWSVERGLCRSYAWKTRGVDVRRARWSPAEASVLASVSRDRAVTLFDARHAEPARRVVLSSRPIAISWNPRDPTSFFAGLDDATAVAFDVRKLNAPRMIFVDCAGPVVDLDVAPSGREFVAASADGTLRLFPLRGPDLGRSRDCYHTSRMQTPACVRYAKDASYLVSGSSDANLRIWRARAATKPGGRATTNPREAAALRYRATLLEKHRHLPEVSRILRRRHLPKLVRKLKQRQAERRDKDRRKTQNLLDHSSTAAPKPRRSTLVLRDEA